MASYVNQQLYEQPPRGVTGRQLPVHYRNTGKLACLKDSRLGETGRSIAPTQALSSWMIMHSHFAAPLAFRCKRDNLALFKALR